jgi:hypothetical protein
VKKNDWPSFRSSAISRQNLCGLGLVRNLGFGQTSSDQRLSKCHRKLSRLQTKSSSERVEANPACQDRNPNDVGISLPNVSGLLI